MIVKFYQDDLKSVWDEFISKAKNSHFIFYRNYLEYHRDRFKDFSLMIYDEKHDLVAVFPANISNGVVYSHQGLTFGGVLSDVSMKTDKMLNIFTALSDFFKANGLKSVVYKCIPYIYSFCPAEEDRYALFVNNARLLRRDVSSTIDLAEKMPYQDQRKRAVKRAVKNGVCFAISDDFSSYWSVLEETLSKQHSAKPVHSLSEITKLARLFPENIKLFLAKRANVVLAGTVIFENRNIAHAQYLASSQEGRQNGALDFVLDKLINQIYREKKYFDFGISNENNGLYLNRGLISQKEGFGGRAVVHDCYDWSLE